MELIMPDQIALDGTSLALIDDVEEVARTVNEYRPLPFAVLKRIQDELLGERVQASNAIEGNTLDLRETVQILKTGAISGGKKKRDATEARNLGDAARQVTAWIDAKEPCHTTDRLLSVHATILRDIDDDWAGKLRTTNVMIQAAKYQPPDPSLVAPLVARLVDGLGHNDETNPLIKAVWAHWALARIHPFHDANGRMARLWQDIVLLEGNLTYPIIQKRDRREYFDALTSADDGDFNPLVQLIANRVSKTFERFHVGIAADKETV